MIESFDRLLNEDFSVDYWSDEGVVIAEKKLDKFSAHEWSMLSGLCQCRSPGWLIKCAESLYGALNKEVLQVVLILLKSPDEDVIYQALVTLEFFISHTEVSKDQVDEINEVVVTIKEKGGANALLVSAILGRLKKQQKNNENNREKQQGHI